MIVLDASTVVEILTGGALSESIMENLAHCDDSFIVPHLLDIEVVSAVRRLTAGRRIDSSRSDQLLEELSALPAVRYGHTPLLGRMWQLRHNFTAFDAAYIALAEATDSVLYTCDEMLRGGHGARVVVFTHP